VEHHRRTEAQIHKGGKSTMTKRRWPVLVVGAAAFSVIGANLPASAASATQHFLSVQTSPTASTFEVSASGPIHALGVDHVLAHNKDIFVFPKGSINVTHRRTSGTQHFDKANCTAQITEQGTYKITGGAKAYAKASGNGTYSVVGYFVGCNPKKPPTTFSLVIQAAGPIHLPG
jgi:hypothetical protein